MFSFYDWIHSLSYFYSTEFLNDPAFPQALVLDEKNVQISIHSLISYPNMKN